MTKKIKLGVIFGGKSEEHIVSIMSAKSILQHVDKNKYDIYPLGISKEGNWVYLEHIYGAVNDNKIDDLDLELLVQEANPESSYKAIGMLMNKLDVVFPVLHGPYGEDGTLQGLFEMLDIPYVGANVPSSAVCMDKVFTKEILKNVGINVTDSITLYKHAYNEDAETYIKKINTMFTYPVFVKPANLGSSVGITKVKDNTKLSDAISQAFKYDSKILIEQGVECREIECAVLGNTNPKASIVGEILPSHEFYDFEAKYFDDGNSKMVIPAPVSEELSEELRTLALKAYQTIGITGLSRIDFFVDKSNGKIYLNEINTLPGFTQFSMYPLLWAESGLAYTDLISKLIGLAFERKEDI